jgi:ribosomal protein S18 acetylase RimI-like enzyme
MTAASDIVRAAPDRLSVLAGVLARAFHDDPMIQWPLDWGGSVETITRMFAHLYEEPIRSGLLWEAGRGAGVAVWFPPGESSALLEADRAARERFAALVPDRGARYGALWDWLETKIPPEPIWYLDAIAVDTDRRGTGVGGALIRHGLTLAETDGVPAFLETAKARNVGLYERFGFRVVEEEDAPGGGPHIWFMRTR